VNEWLKVRFLVSMLKLHVGQKSKKPATFWVAGLIPQGERGRDRYLLKKHCDT